MGDSADDILQTLRLDEGTVSYEEIKISLNDYFAARRNIIVERVRFNKRSQKPGESVDTFIQDLYRSIQKVAKTGRICRHIHPGSIQISR